MNNIERLQKLCAGGKAAIVTTPINRRYLLGFESSAGALVITEHDALFIIDFRYIEAAKSAIKNARVVMQEKLFEQINGQLKAQGAKAAVCERELTVGAFEGFAAQLCVPLSAEPWLSNEITDMRCIKTAEEKKHMQRAQDIADAAFTHICGFIKAGMTENEVALELEFTMRRSGAQRLSFETICVAGENGSRPHGVPGERKIANGDLLTMDFGAVWQGYCSDMTRTVAVGEIDARQKKVYDTVLKAQLAALNAAKPGITGAQLDAVARDIIYSAGYEGCFGHGLGHSVGLEIHESPRASAADNTVLRAGTVMTVEPGIYIEGVCGVRIEDMVILTENGCENFTHSPKELIIL